MSEQEQPKQRNWLKISLAANIVILLGIAGALVAMGLLHQSDTNPHFCATCHVMQKNVNSYLTSANLDSVHRQADVQCKECHDYPIPAEIRSGVNFVIGNYYVEDDGSLVKHQYDNDMCLQCHISQEHVINSTDFLVRNPHLSHLTTDITCSDCHISHGEQIDTCSECHDHGQQRLVGSEIIPRAENPWAKPGAEKPVID